MNEERSIKMDARIQFEGDESFRQQVVRLLDEALKKGGDIGAYGDLSGGIEDLITDSQINIKDEGTVYSVSIAPLDSTGGHDFSFTLDKTTGQISDVDVGNILPPPDIE